MKSSKKLHGSKAPIGIVESVVVAVNVTKEEMAKHALEWTLSNIVQAGDHITIVALLQGGATGHGRRLWGLPWLAGDCANRASKGVKRRVEEVMDDLYPRTMQELHALCDAKQVTVSVRVVPCNSKGAVSMEAQKIKATWVVLDSQVKKEEGKRCMDDLQCNLVVVMKGDDAKILRINLRSSNRKTTHPHPHKNQVAESHSTVKNPRQQTTACHGDPRSLIRRIAEEEGEGTSLSSPEVRTPFTATDKGTSSATSSDLGTSPLIGLEAVSHYAKHDHCGLSTLMMETTSPKLVGDENSKLHTNPPTMVESDTESDYEILARDEESSGHESSEATNAGCRDSLSSRDTLDSIPHQMWPDYGIENEHKEGSWMMHMTKARLDSGSVTRKLVVPSQLGRSSTPASPLGASKRITGRSVVSFNAREHRHLQGMPAHRQMHAGKSLQPSEIEKSKWSKRMLAIDDLLDKFSRWNPDDIRLNLELGSYDVMSNNMDLERTSSVRRAVLLSKNVPLGPPPLCSICQHKGPVFGKPPRRFTFADLELATGGFSQANFLAEGGYGCVHRGVLPDGQAVAVKQHKLASSQGDVEFCSEVEVLSCAQHRNVVMLIGYCIEDKRRLLVYEFVCNGSLDSHLYGKKEKGCLEWAARQKVAVGAARGLRYLHEECRVGCIVHRDMRPNNILLTHDFEPMVGDFGLARWQPDGDFGVQTRVIGTFGFLAPEYAQSGQVTEKADVYSFGVVLLELVTGRKAVDLNRPKGQQCLTEWARPLLEERATEQLVDPLLNGRFSGCEMQCMLYAASLCIRKDPHHRPRMSQVLRILEGDVVIDKGGSSSTPCYGRKLDYDDNTSSGYGSQSSRMFNERVVNKVTRGLAPPWRMNFNASFEPRGENNSCDGHDSNKLSYEALKAAYKDKSNTRRLSYEDIM